MKTVFFESLHYKFITKNDFYYGSCLDIRIPFLTFTPTGVPRTPLLSHFHLQISSHQPHLMSHFTWWSAGRNPPPPPKLPIN